MSGSDILRAGTGFGVLWLDFVSRNEFGGDNICEPWIDVFFVREFRCSEIGFFTRYISQLNSDRKYDAYHVPVTVESANICASYAS